MAHIAQSPGPTLSQLIRSGELQLVIVGVPNARRNAEWMLSHALDCRATDLYLDTHRVPEPDRIECYRRLISRRAHREPLQYILGMTEFMSLPFHMTPGVFIPRPDTECVVELAETRLAGGAAERVLDLCCGSGVIAVSLVRRNGMRATAVDISPAAAELTRHNAELNGVADRITCLTDDAIAFLRGNDERFDMIVCNPPYIATGELVALPPEVRDHEPAASLDGGPDGLSFYRSGAALLREALSPGAPVFLEIGADQAPAVVDILTDAALVDIEVHPDYAGRDRVVIAHRPLEK